MTIRSRLTLIISALLSATLLATLLILGVSEFLHLRRAQEREQRTTLDKIAKVCEEAVLNHNDVLLLNYLQSLQDVPGFLYAGFMDAEGVTQVHTDVALLGRRLDDEAGRRALEARAPLRQAWMDGQGRRVLEWAVPVVGGGARLGTARLGYDAAILERGIRDVLKASLLRFLWVVLGALGLGFAGAASLARGFNRPIAQLAEGARIIGGGGLDHRLELDRSDELGLLAGEFNRMGERLKELDELKESFLHSVSHDMRSPLTAILGYVTVLKEDKKSAPSPLMRQGLGIIEDETRRLNLFINDILDLAKLEAKKMEFDLQTMAIEELARDVVTLFKATAEKSGIRLELALPDANGSGPWTVRGDPKALRRVLVNLVSNALKFTPDDGSIRVALKDDGAAVEVSVKDSGIGIPRERLGEMFTKFSQVKETRDIQRKVAGTGLGLALCKEFVEAHGGEIGVSSEPGKGANFYFKIPKA